MSWGDIPTLVARAVAYPSTSLTPLSTIREENPVFKPGSLRAAVMARSSSESALAATPAGVQSLSSKEDDR
jgi:hypothetical protein